MSSRAKLEMNTTSRSKAKAFFILNNNEISITKVYLNSKDINFSSFKILKSVVLKRQAQNACKHS